MYVDKVKKKTYSVKKLPVSSKSLSASVDLPWSILNATFYTIINQQYITYIIHNTLHNN